MKPRFLAAEDGCMVTSPMVRGSGGGRFLRSELDMKRLTIFSTLFFNILLENQASISEIHRSIACIAAVCESFDGETTNPV